MVNFLYYCIQRDRVSINSIVLMAFELFKEIPLLQQSLTVAFLVFKKKKNEALRNMASIVFMLKHHVAKLNNIQLKPIDLDISHAIMSWLETIISAISADVSISPEAILETMCTMIEQTNKIFERYEDKVEAGMEKLFGHHTSRSVAEIL